MKLWLLWGRNKKIVNLCLPFEYYFCTKSPGIYCFYILCWSPLCFRCIVSVYRLNLSALNIAFLDGWARILHYSRFLIQMVSSGLFFFFIFVNKEYAIKDQMMRLISRFWDIVLRYEILRYFYGAHARLFFLFPFLHFGVNKSYLFIN